MTRDEAIEKLDRDMILRRATGQYRGMYAHGEDARDFVNNLVALGLLKLEEPKGLTAQQRYRLSDEMAKRGFSLSTCVLEDVLQAAGLRIVESKGE